MTDTVHVLVHGEPSSLRPRGTGFMVDADMKSPSRFSYLCLQTFCFISVVLLVSMVTTTIQHNPFIIGAFMQESLTTSDFRVNLL